MRALAVLLVLLGCHLPPSALSPANAAQSTFRLDVSITAELVDLGLEAHMGSRATAWVVRNADARSYLLTAGHACPPLMVKTDAGLARLRATFELVADDGTRHRAEVLARSDDPDLCLLATDAPVGPALRLADRDPDRYDEVAYVGSPAGAFGDGVAPLYRGTYAGRTVVTAPTAPGASGSALFTSRGVFGVLVAVNRRFDALTTFVPRAEILRFLRDTRMQ